MSFYHLPHPWNPGYAIPKYVMAEPPGRGTFTTTWLPRRTISQLIPDYLAKPVDQKLLGRRDAQLGSLSGSTLGAEEYKLVPTGQTAVPGVLTDASLTLQLINHCMSKNVEAAAQLLKAAPKVQRQTIATNAITAGADAACVNAALAKANETPWTTYALIGAGALVALKLLRK